MYVVLCRISFGGKKRRLLFKRLENHLSRPFKDWVWGIKVRYSLTEMFRIFGLHSWEPCGCKALLLSNLYSQKT